MLFSTTFLLLPALSLAATIPGGKQCGWTSTSCQADQSCCLNPNDGFNSATCCSGLLGQKCVNGQCVPNNTPTGKRCGTTTTYCQGDQSCCLSEDGLRAVCCSGLLGQTCRNARCTTAPTPPTGKKCGWTSTYCQGDQSCCLNQDDGWNSATCCSGLLGQKCVNGKCVAGNTPTGKRCGNTTTYCMGDQKCCLSEDGLRAVCCDAHQSGIKCRNAQCLKSGGKF